jgi:hypothetical protein
MPRLVVRGVLERSASASLFKYTLSKIPTTYGRLSYLASLRDSNTGKYRHHGLFSTFGRKEGAEALERSHDEEFARWVNFSVEEKYDDLKVYLATVEDTEKTVLRHWLHSRVFRSYVPASASEAQKKLFSEEIETLLTVLLASTKEN